MQAVRMGMIGYGMSGSVFHAPLITAVEGMELAAVVSGRPEQVAKDYPGTKVFAAVDALCADQSIDVVVVTSPNPTHYIYARQALEAGKHVVVEKPFVNKVREADDLIQLAASKQLLLSVFQNRRWDNDFLTVRQVLQEGVLGEIFSYQAHYDMYRPQVGPKWKEHAGEGSGALFDLGPHLIDQALQLFGMPETVWCERIKQRPNAEVDDYFHLVLGYGRLRVILHSGWVVKYPGPHFQIHGSKGSLIKYGLDSQQGDLQKGLRPGHPAWGKDNEENYARIAVAQDSTAAKAIETIPGCYEEYYRQFRDAVQKGTKLPVTAQEARDVMRIIEMGVESSESGQTIRVN